MAIKWEVQSDALYGHLMNTTPADSILAEAIQNWLDQQDYSTFCFQSNWDPNDIPF